MEKLELKHLAPYLPYELKMAFIVREEIIKVGALNNISINNSNTYPIRYSIDTLNELEHEWMFKPILRPLSDLTKEINYGLSTYAFTDLFEIGDCDGCVFEFEHGNIKTIKSLENISKYNSYNDINYLPNAVVNMMHEYHFDVFGLIEKGLAIDINKLS